MDSVLTSKVRTSIYLVIAVLFSTYHGNAQRSEDVQRLSSDLFVNYSKQMRPDEKEQEFLFSAWLYMEWYDEFLRWDPADYNNVSTILVPPSQVWRPDIAISNSFERMTKFASGEYLIRVDSDGLVDWSPGDIFKTHCTVDITFYPFDTQTCNITVGTWMYDVGEVDISPLGNTSLADFSVSGEWDVISSKSYKEKEYFDCCPGEETVTVTFSLVLTRRKTFYVLTVIIPVLLFTFLNVVDFILPPESGEKMSLSVTVFLSFAFFMSILNDSMPRTSLSFSILGIYMILVMGMGTLSVLLSAVVIMLYHRSGNKHQTSTTAIPQHRRHAENPPDFLPGIEQFDNLSEKLDGRFDNSDVSEVYSLAVSPQTMATEKQSETASGFQRDYVQLARSLDRFTLWFFLCITILGSTTLVCLLNYH